MKLQLEGALKYHWQALGADGQMGEQLWAALRPATQNAYARGMRKWLIFAKEASLDISQPSNVQVGQFI